MDETMLREPVITEVRQPTQISWGAIFAGWVVAAGLAWLFYQFGAAIGLSIIDPAQDNAGVGRGFSYGAGLWIFLTWVVTLYLGGRFAARLAGQPDSTVGRLHGMVVWGLVIFTTLVLGAAGVASAARGGASLIGGGLSLGAMAGSAAAGTSGQGQGGGATEVLQAEIKQGISNALASQGNIPPAQINQAMNQLDSTALAGIAGRMLRGDTEGAKNLIAARTNLNRADVDRVVNGLSSQVQTYKAQAQQVAQQAAKYTAAVLWVMFISGLAGLIAAIIGGSMGAKNAATAVRVRYAETE